MRSILRGTGQTFTKPKANGAPLTSKSLQRGLKNDLSGQNLLSGGRPGELFDLANFLRCDPNLFLRQTIAVLDKVVSKRTNLKHMECQAYIDRAILGELLWQRLAGKFRNDWQNQPGRDGIAASREIWVTKVHPYSRFDPDSVNPARDQNAAYIRETSDGTRSREDFQGRWHRTFWKEKTDGRPDYEAIADKIWTHLEKNEFKIKGIERRKSNQVGLTEARGAHISGSVHDPRYPRKKEHYRNFIWDKETENNYFYSDVAATIFAAALSSQTGSNEKFYPSSIGEILHKHFKLILDGNATRSDEDRKKFWSLHNHIRHYYQRTAKSQRFKVACHQGAEAIGRILPEDKVALLRAIHGKKRNSDLGHLIRLGKLVVHASDLPRGVSNANNAFARRMNYLVTSDGQSEIKRNEVFTRVWRNAIGLSQRTLKLWVEKDPKKPVFEIEDGEPNYDLASGKVSGRAVQTMSKKRMRRGPDEDGPGHFDPDHFARHVSVLFGSKPFGDEGRSRASIIVNASEEANRELMWTMLRIGGELRNRTNHFSTKRRLVDLLTDGIVDGVEDANLKELFMSRPNHLVKKSTIETLDKLLELDWGLQNQILADELKAMKFGVFTPTDQKSIVLAELCQAADDSKITYPRLKSVLWKAKKLAENRDGGVPAHLQQLGAIKLDANQIRDQGINEFRISLLSLLYGSGFQHWLEDARPEGLDFVEIIQSVIGDKKTRTQKSLEEKGLIYTHADLLIERMEIGSTESLAKFLSGLTSLSYSEERLGQKYNPDRNKQREQSNKIEEFKQEIFAALLARYLQDRKLEWIFDPRLENGADQPAGDVNASEVALPSRLEAKPWHSQFYAWLYLVPVDDVSMLRHQFKKTAVLEAKAAPDEEDANPELRGTLRDVDRLMGLYTRVQSAGFDGTEHIGELEAGKLFYTDPNLFEEFYSADADTHATSYAGTRRGLRQLLRFGNNAALKRIFEKHRVTDGEVNVLVSLDDAQIKSIFDRKDNLHDWIVEACKEERPKVDKIRAACQEYETAASDVAFFNFTVAAARLTEFARLNQLLMRIVGRLTDYTLMWERDMNYLFLGLLYRQATPFDGDGQPTGHGLKAVCQPADADGKNGNRILIQYGSDPSDSEAIWDEKSGFCLPKFSKMADVLTKANWEAFWRWFSGSNVPNCNDEDRHKRRETAANGRPVDFHNDGYWAIRNDFAHYNVLSGDGSSRRHMLNLTWKINAVRSMFGYDRKLKNAVVQSIKRIVEHDGLEISWTMQEDRLKHPRAVPRFETHLTMVRRNLVEGAQFFIPKTSVRYTSMVNALFSFETGGLRKQLKVGGEMKRAGTLAYPAELPHLIPGGRVPKAVEDYTLPELPSDLW